MKYSEVEQYPNEWLNTITHEDIENNTFPVIVDRDETDVDRFETFKQTAPRIEDWGEAEWQYWDSVIKGAYKDEDMNRVGAAVDYIVGRMKELGYAPEVLAKTDWVKADIPTPAQRERYLENIRELRSQLTLYPSTPPVPADMRHLWWWEANDIEKILLDIDDLLTKSSRSLYYSGELFSNEV